MRRRILAAMLVVASLAIAALALPLSVRLGRDARAQVVSRLERVAIAESVRVPTNLSQSTHLAIPDIAYDGDLTIFDAHGRWVAGEGSHQADAATRGALAGRTTARTDRLSIAVAVPVVRGLKVVAAVRASQPVAVSRESVRRQRIAILVFGCAALTAALVVGLAVSAAIARPLRRLGTDATRLGAGDFTARAHRSRIREIDEVANALDDTAQRLGGMIDRERAFSAQASHQLRTPLTSLRLAIETELQSPRPNHEIVLNELLVEADRLEATISELLALARNNAPQTLTDAGTIARTVDDRWRGRLAATGRSLRLVVDSAAPPVRTSPIALGQILDVLCDNALRHGSGVVTIAVRRGLGGGTVITVADDGNGMTTDPLTADATGSSDLHGMGLAIARSIAESQGARLRLANLGHAPVFEITLS